MSKRLDKTASILIIVVPASALAAIFFLYRSSASANEILEGRQFLLDTIVSIRLYDSSGDAALTNAFSLIGEYESELSRYKSESNVFALNAAPVGTAVPVSGNLAEVLALALHYAEISGGSFDPTIAPLVDLWGIGGTHPQIPDARERLEAAELVDYRFLELNDRDGTVRLTREGMAVDLGGIAKGWIADRIADALAQAGEEHILINLGGNVLARGGKPDGSPFLIGMQDPGGDRIAYLGVFSVHDGSVVSSGVYERYFEEDGRRYHHILDPFKGMPISNGLTAVTVLTDESADGDALSTTLFAMGLEKGLEFVSGLEDVEAAFITADETVVLTPGAAEAFKPTRVNLKTEIRGR